MIAYVETNLIVEIVLDQEQAESALRIVDLAKDGHVQLVLPALCIAESNWAIEGKERQRKTLLEELSAARQEVSRSTREQGLAESLGSLSAAIRNLYQTRLRSFRSLAEEILHFSELIGLNKSTYVRAMAPEYGQEFPDSVVLASIHEHLADQDRNVPKLFATRDLDLFGLAKDVLSKEFNCVCIPRYDDAVNYIEAKLRS